MRLYCPTDLTIWRADTKCLRAAAHRKTSRSAEKSILAPSLPIRRKLICMTPVGEEESIHAVQSPGDKRQQFNGPVHVRGGPQRLKGGGQVIAATRLAARSQRSN